MTRDKRLLKAIEAAIYDLDGEGSGDISLALEYAEPGYKRKRNQRAILFANWNTNRKRDYPTSIIRTAILPAFPKIEEQEILNCIERHYAIEWSDEWAICFDCGKAIRTSPDSYSWKRSFYLGDGEVLCLNCIDYESIITEFINNPSNAWTYDAKYLRNAGFRVVEGGDFSTGLRECSKNPEDVYNKYKTPDIDLLFCIESAEQFGVEVVLYSRPVNKGDK